MSRGPILLATRNEGKLVEVRELLVAAGIAGVDLRHAGIEYSQEEEDTLERFPTFRENALAKARYFALRSGMPAIADDSGLEVAALGGRPGVMSKRWNEAAGLEGEALDRANNSALLAALAFDENREARYVCVAVYVGKDAERHGRGECTGRILRAPRGVGGFAYDPLFESDDLGLTFGECSREQKSRVSHRARAFRALLEQLGEPLLDKHG